MENTPAVPSTAPESTLFLVMVAEKAPVIMCERHSSTYQALCADINLPATVVPMPAEDVTTHKCMVCDLADELTRPHIILPD
jgi:hypothetical protein